MSDIEKAAERIENILANRPQQTKRHAAEAFRAHDGSIALRNISFGLSNIAPVKLLNTLKETKPMAPPEKTKFCLYHKCDHPVSEFYSDKNSKDGLRTYCKKAELDMERTRIANKKAHAQNCIILDFTQVPGGLDLLELIHKNAGESMREPDKEIIFQLKGILNPKKTLSRSNQE